MPRMQRLLLVFLFLVSAGPAFAQVVVSNANMQGWTLTASSGTGDVPPPAAYLAPGFEVPPLGDGSLHLHVGQDGNDAAQARTDNFTGTRIDAITALSYSTFTEVGSGDQSPYLLFHVDTDGNLGTADTQLWFFEPLYQGPTFFPSNPQGPPAVDTWQSWDARSGGWYTTGGLAGSGPGVNVKSIEDLLAAAPNATIISSGTGGVRIVTGFGAPIWNNYAGAADSFRFATAGSDVTYDFEPDATTVVTVTPSMLEEWTLTTTDGGAAGGSPSTTIVTGPGTPPLPPGSLRLDVGTDGDDSAEARSDRWDDSFLRDLSALTYDTYHESGGSGGQMAYLMLRVDYDGNGMQDDLLFFEPVYQDGTFCTSNPQPAIVTATWQTWDAAGGCWWSLSGTAGATPGVGVKPLSTILATEPDARFAIGATGGSLRVVAGFGAGAWDDFIGYVDNLNVVLAPIPDTTYDFDPDPSISIADVAAAEGNAGTTPFTFNLTLSHAVSYAVIADYSTGDGSATVADADYATQTAQTVTFPANTTAATIAVDVNGDVKFEPAETFVVDLSAPAGATIADTQAVGTIQNDDAQPTIAINNVTAADDPDAGTTTFIFNVTLSNPSATTITVDFTTADGTAVAPDDYTATSGTLTFNPGVTLQQVSVSVIGDTTLENSETFFVDLSNPVAATISDAQGVGTITNDDPQPQISISDVTLAEGDAGTTNFVFDVTLGNASSSTITVDFTTADDTALAPDDYATTAGTVTFDPGETAQTITVPVVGETAFESDEAFFVNLANPVAASILDPQGTGTITNDDLQPAVLIADASTVEGDAATTNLVFNVTLTNASDSTVTVDFATADDTAVAPADYTVTSGTVTFNPGVTVQTITVPIAGETTFETDETFFVNLTNPSNATVGDAQAVGTITNDDSQPAISIGDVTLAEGNAGTTSFVFNVTLSNPSDAPTTVDFTTTDDTAVAPADYATTSGTLTFNPGVVLQTITVPVVGDTAFEPDETFFVDLSNPGSATILDARGVGTIQNDEGVPAVSIADVTLPESDGGTNFVFNVTLSGPSSSTVTVDYSTADDTASAPSDYATTSGTLTFTPGTVLQTITVPVVGDTAFEPDETFFGNLTNASGATIADTQGLGTITNDDGAAADLTLTKDGPATVTAGTPINYLITVSNAGPQAATNVVVTDVLPAGTTFVSATPSQGTCSGTSTVNCNLGTIPNGASATITLIVNAPTTPGPISNTATASAPEADATPAAATAPTTVTAAAAAAAQIPTASELGLLAMLMALAAAAALKLRT